MKEGHRYQLHHFHLNLQGMTVADTLKVGGSANVLFPQLIGTPILEGTIAHVATVADPGSETQLIRIVIPNPDGFPGGSHVVVTFQ